MANSSKFIDDPGNVILYFGYWMPALSMTFLNFYSNHAGQSIGWTIIGFVISWIPFLNWVFIFMVLFIDDHTFQLVRPVLINSLLFWGLAIPFFYLIIVAIRKNLEAQKNQAEEKRRERQNIILEEKYRQESKQRLLRSLMNINTVSFNIFEELPNYLIRAEKLLDQAEIKFNETAFVPFWEDIEAATMQLKNYNDGIKNIIGNLRSRQDIIYDGQSLKITPPPFSVKISSINALTSSNKTSGRLKAITKKAQSNFQFASIYQQYNTNKILLAGFHNLSDAIYNMGDAIQLSIMDVSKQISTLNENFNKQNENFLEALDAIKGVGQSIDNIGSSAEDAIKSYKKDLSNREIRERQILQMLDNIQRGRRPPLF